MASANASIVPSVSSGLIRRDNLETYSLMWVDRSVNSNENRNAQQQLHSTINHIRVFKNDTECETYIRQSKDDQILLIASEELGYVIVPCIHSLRQTNSTYIYCLNSRKHQEWASKFTKIQAVATDLNELSEEIEANRTRREKSFDEPLPISIFNSVFNEERSSTNINGGFLHFQLLINVLLRLRRSQTSLDDFFDLCEKEYDGNDVQLSILREIRKSYNPERALHYYTQHLFFYQMLNKALRVQNINLLFLCRFFIQDLYQQLEKLQREQDQTPIRVYRGQLMSKPELDVLKESKGKFISMNSFLSTSLVREISLSFVSSEHDDLYRVLFKIDIDPHLSDRAKPFANISSESQFVSEQEILFMVATIFRLVDIRQDNEITVVQMKLCNENYDPDIKFLFEHMQKEIEEYDERLQLGHTLRTAGMFDQAEQVYNRILNELADDDPLIADVWSSIGRVKKAKGELEISAQWLNKAFKKYEQMEDRVGLAKCLQYLGNIHQMNREPDQAINKYNQALNIFKELLGDQNKAVANCLNNLGVSYFEQRKFSEADQYYMDALAIQKTILPHTHPDIAGTLNNLGSVCFANDECTQAIHYFNQALDIYTISLPSEHPSIALTYYNKGLAYLRQGDYQRSLLFLNRADSIYRNILSPDHRDLHRCAKAINYVKQTYNK